MRRFISLLALVTTVGAAGTAFAQDEPKTKFYDFDDKYSGSGADLVIPAVLPRERDYTSALSHYFASNRLAPNQNVTFNIARCYDRLERPVEAYRYYARYRAVVVKEADIKAADDAMERLRPRLAS
mgnify:CR=1 FL=1